MLVWQAARQLMSILWKPGYNQLQLHFIVRHITCDHFSGCYYKTGMCIGSVTFHWLYLPNYSVFHQNIKRPEFIQTKFTHGNLPPPPRHHAARYPRKRGSAGYTILKTSTQKIMKVHTCNYAQLGCCCMPNNRKQTFTLTSCLSDHIIQ